MKSLIPPHVAREDYARSAVRLTLALAAKLTVASFSVTSLFSWTVSAGVTEGTWSDEGSEPVAAGA